MKCVLLASGGWLFLLSSSSGSSTCRSARCAALLHRTQECSETNHCPLFSQHTHTCTLPEGFNQVLDVDKAGYTVRVQAGLKVLDLMRWADANGMATAIGAPCNYAELTIGGVISANGHGTGSNVTSSLVRLVKGAAAGSSMHAQGRR